MNEKTAEELALEGQIQERMIEQVRNICSNLGIPVRIFLGQETSNG